VHQLSCATTVYRAKQSSFRADSCEQVRDGYYYVKRKSTERAGKLCLYGMVTWQFLWVLCSGPQGLVPQLAEVPAIVIRNAQHMSLKNVWQKDTVMRFAWCSEFPWHVIGVERQIGTAIYHGDVTFWSIKHQQESEKNHGHATIVGITT
jgi:hypothetical protein